LHVIDNTDYFEDVSWELINMSRNIVGGKLFYKGEMII